MIHLNAVKPVNKDCPKKGRKVVFIDRLNDMQNNLKILKFSGLYSQCFL